MMGTEVLQPPLLPPHRRSRNHSLPHAYNMSAAADQHPQQSPSSSSPHQQLSSAQLIREEYEMIGSGDDYDDDEDAEGGSRGSKHHQHQQTNRTRSSSSSTRYGSRGGGSTIIPHTHSSGGGGSHYPFSSHHQQRQHPHQYSSSVRHKKSSSLNNFTRHLQQAVPPVATEVRHRLVTTVTTKFPHLNLANKGSSISRCLFVMRLCGLSHPGRSWRRSLQLVYRFYTLTVLGTALFHSLRAFSYILQHWKGLDVGTSFMIGASVYHFQTLFIAIHSLILLNKRVNNAAGSPSDQQQEQQRQQQAGGDEDSDLISHAGGGRTTNSSSDTLVQYFVDWEIRNGPEFSWKPYMTFWIQFIMAFVNFTIFLVSFVLQGFEVLHPQFPTDYYFDGVVQSYLLPVFMCHSFLFYCISITIYVTIFALLSDWANRINKGLANGYQEPSHFRQLLSAATVDHQRLSEKNKYANLMYRVYVTFLLATDLPIFIVLFYVTCLATARNSLERTQAGIMAAGLLVQMSLLLSPSSFYSAATPPLKRLIHERYLTFIQTVRGQEAAPTNSVLIQESGNFMAILSDNPLGLWVANVCVLKQMAVLSVIVIGIAFSTGYLMLGNVMANCWQPEGLHLLSNISSASAGHHQHHPSPSSLSHHSSSSSTSILVNNLTNIP